MIRAATPDDTPAIAELIRGLAEYEHLAHEVTLDEAELRAHLFGERRYAEVILAEDAGEAIGFALFFHNFSTFLGKPGIYLEDLFVRPEHRGRRPRQSAVRAPRAARRRARLRAAGVERPRLERALDPVLPLARRAADGGVDDVPAYRRGAARARGCGIDTGKLRYRDRAELRSVVSDTRR